MNREQISNYKFVNDIVGEISGGVNYPIDLQGFDSAMVVLLSGSAIGSFEILESDDGTTFNVADGSDVSGGVNNFEFVADGQAKGAYLGPKRYIQIKYTMTTTGIGASFVALGNAQVKPVY